MHFPRGADYLLHLTQSLHSFWGFSLLDLEIGPGPCRKAPERSVRTPYYVIFPYLKGEYIVV